MAGQQTSDTSGKEKRSEAENGNLVQKLQSAIIGILLTALLGYMLSLGDRISEVAGRCDAGLTPIAGQELRDHVLRIIQTQNYIDNQMKSLDVRISDASAKLNSAALSLIDHAGRITQLSEKISMIRDRDHNEKR